LVVFGQHHELLEFFQLKAREKRFSLAPRDVGLINSIRTGLHHWIYVWPTKVLFIALQGHQQVVGAGP
jgi:hypothetical protein